MKQRIERIYCSCGRSQKYFGEDAVKSFGWVKGDKNNWICPFCSDNVETCFITKMNKQQLQYLKEAKKASSLPYPFCTLAELYLDLIESEKQLEALKEKAKRSSR